MTPAKDEIRAKASALGIDRVGFAAWRALEAAAPEYDRPSQISTHLTTLIVLVKRYPTGVAIACDDALRQYATGRTARHLEEAAALLAYWLEERDVMASLLSAMIPDLRRQPLAYSCPAGQGSLLLRKAAVAAGLGSLGLNEMLLTPEFGPRVFLAGVLSDVAVEVDAPFAGELCPGLEACGRCAAVCPEQAIPLRAPAGAPLESYRGLDAEACARSSQPYGPARLVEHLERAFTAEEPGGAASVAREKTTLHLWYNLTVLRQGAFTGCSRCEIVCPVGFDYPAIERELPPVEVRHTTASGLVSVESVTVIQR
jgi:ferredoxin